MHVFYPDYATGRFSFSNYSSLSGALIENFVYRELLMKKKCDKVNFYRTVSKSEIDFIVSSEEKLIPVEVKFSGKESLFPRAMKQFNLNYCNIAKNIVVTRQHIAYEKENNCYYIPVYLLPFIRFDNRK
jgi:predicted AAA+ superfamily ATPase